MKHFSKLIIILLLTSCTSTKIIELGERTSIKGAEVSQKALDIYTLLSQQAVIDKSQQDKVKVLINPNPSEMQLPNTKAQDFSKQLAPRINAYQSLLYTYKSFALLTDSKYGDKTQEAATALGESYNSIEKFPDIPSVVSSKLPEVSKIITQAIQTKKIKTHNEILSSLTSLYILLWKQDLKLWNEYIDRIYDDYSTDLNNVDSKRYNAKKISEDSKEPYSDESTVILMYRLDKREEIIKNKNELKKQLNDFTNALEELNKVHVEISKSRTDISAVIKTLNSIDNFLKQK